MDRRFVIWTILGMLLVMLAANVSAIASLGITPGRTTLEFEPSLARTITVNVLNPEGKAINLAISVQGDLEDYITLHEGSISLKENEDVREIKFDLNLPKELPPGLQTAEIVVLQLPESAPLSESNLRAVLAVVTQIHVNVPYPGKYAEAELNVADPDGSGQVTFVIPVINRGNADIVEAYANFDIYNSLGEKVASFNTDSIGIKSGERKEIVKKWEANVSAGNYRAVATLSYDGESRSLQTAFSVGASTLELQEVKVGNFALGQIAKFEMLVESKWSERMKDVFTQTRVFDSQGRVMAEFKSPTYDIEPLSKGIMVSYWDTKGVKVGTYDASIYLNYAGKSVQKDVKFEVNEDSLNVVGLGYVISGRGTATSGQNSALITILIVGIIVLILANISWFLLLRNRLKGGAKSK